MAISKRWADLCGRSRAFSAEARRPLSALLVKVLDLTEAQQLAAAELVRISLPAYYDLFNIEPAKLLDAIRRQFRVSGSEVSSGMALLDSDTAGVFFGLPMHQLRRAQLLGLMALKTCAIRDPAALAESVKALRDQIEPPPSEGHYLTRFAVRADRRGSGAADRLIDAFLASVPAAHQAVLHVHRDNVRALRFYERHGFSASAVRQEHQYIVMTRSPSEPG